MPSAPSIAAATIAVAGVAGAVHMYQQRRQQGEREAEAERAKELTKQWAQSQAHTLGAAPGHMAEELVTKRLFQSQQAATRGPGAID